MSRKYLIAGNWKMNKTATEAVDLIEEVKLSRKNFNDYSIDYKPLHTKVRNIEKNIFEKLLFRFLRSKKYLKNGRSFVMICKRRS